MTEASVNASLIGTIARVIVRPAGMVSVDGQQQAEAMEVDSREYEMVEISDLDVREIVLSHLVHNCYKETAQTFIESAGMQRSTNFCAGIDTRKAIYNAVLRGAALEAIGVLKQLDGDILANNVDIHFDLLTLHFIELIRFKECVEALTFAQRELKPFGQQEKYLEKLQDCMALLAYEEPETSPLFSLLSPEYRQGIADALNRAVLEHENLPGYAPIERLLQQTMVVRQRLHEEAGKDGPPPFCLKSFLNA